MVRHWSWPGASGWWCNNHLETYELVNEGWHPIYEIKNKKNMFETTNQECCKYLMYSMYIYKYDVYIYIIMMYIIYIHTYKHLYRYIYSIVHQIDNNRYQCKKQINKVCTYIYIYVSVNTGISSIFSMCEMNLKMHKLYQFHQSSHIIRVTYVRIFPWVSTVWV